MTPKRLAEIRAAAGAIEHRHIGPAKCSCGWDGYKVRGIMLDYHQMTLDHFARVRRNPVRPANTAHVIELLDAYEAQSDEVKRLRAQVEAVVKDSELIRYVRLHYSLSTDMDRWDRGAGYVADRVATLLSSVNEVQPK